MRYWELIAPVLDQVSFGHRAGTPLDQLESLPYVPGILFAAHICQAEIAGEGFEQFFLGQSADIAPAGATAFHVLSMPKTAEVIEEAIALFGPSYPIDPQERAKCLGAIADDGAQDLAAIFARLDKTFRSLVQTEEGGFNAAADMYAFGFPYG